jgi:hypothetical protein
MPRTCAGTNRNQLNKTKKREAVEREVRALESAVRAELWPLVFFRISPMAQHEGQRAMAMIHADRFRWEQDVLANPQLTAAPENSPDPSGALDTFGGPCEAYAHRGTAHGYRAQSRVDQKRIAFASEFWRSDRRLSRGVRF